MYMPHACILLHTNILTRIAHIISTPWFIAILRRTSWLASISSECSVDSKRQGEPFQGVHDLWSRNDAILRKLDKTWNVVQLFKATIRSQARNQTSGINGKHFRCQSLTRCSCITWRGRLLILDFKLLSLLSTIHALHRVIFGPQYGPGPWKTRNENLFAFHRFKCLNPMRTHHYGCYLRYEVKRGFCAQETGTEKTPSVLNQCVSGKLLINNVFSCVLCTLFGKFPHIFCLPGQAFCVNDLQLHRRLKRTRMKSLLRSHMIQY